MTDYNLTSGIGYYVGTTEAGKTTLAMQHSRELIELTRRPLIVLDSRHIPMFADRYHEHSVAELTECVWKEGHHAFYTPKNEEEVNRICDAVYDGKDCILFVDEVFAYLNSHSPTDRGLIQLMRGHQHARSHLLFTTQHISADIPQAVLACSPHLYIFRTTSPAALKVLSANFAIDPERVRTLPQFAHIHHHSGFEKKRGAPKPPSISDKSLDSQSSTEIPAPPIDSAPVIVQSESMNRGEIKPTE